MGRTPLPGNEEEKKRAKSIRAKFRRGSELSAADYEFIREYEGRPGAKRVVTKGQTVLTPAEYEGRPEPTPEPSSGDQAYTTPPPQKIDLGALFGDTGKGGSGDSPSAGFPPHQSPEPPPYTPPPAPGPMPSGASLPAASEEKEALASLFAAAWVGAIQVTGDITRKMGGTPFPETIDMGAMVELLPPEQRVRAKSLKIDVLPIVAASAKRAAMRFLPDDVSGEAADAAIMLAPLAMNGGQILWHAQKQKKKAKPAPASPTEQAPTPEPPRPPPTPTRNETGANGQIKGEGLIPFRPPHPGEKISTFAD